MATDLASLDKQEQGELPTQDKATIRAKAKEGAKRRKYFRRGRGNMVMIMNSEALKAAFVQARAESCEILERTASVKVEHRDHGTEYWERPEPKPAARNMANGHVLTDAENQRWEISTSPTRSNVR